MITPHRLKDSVSNFGAVHRIEWMEGTVKCRCGEEESFVCKFTGGIDADEAEAWIYDSVGWGDTGLCPLCEAQHQAEEMADRQRQEMKDAIYD